MIGVRRLKDNLLHLNNLRKFIAYEVFREATKSSFKLKISDLPPEGKVLVLAPHPDDDVIGCGGCIKFHTRLKHQVIVVYLTDGSGGSATSKRYLSANEKKQFAKTREQEAAEAAAILAVKDIVFWRYMDGKLVCNQTAIKLMQGVLSKYSPDLVYLPSFLDPHPDHFETCRIFAEVIRTFSFFNGKILSYEVWAPIFANRLVKIDDVWPEKKRALMAHRSQLAERSYLEAVEGLAKYRAGMYRAGRYAEAFFSTNKKLYLQLFDLITFKDKKTEY